MVGEEKVIPSISQYQTKVWSQLTKIAQSGLVGNGYIFSGPAGCGKEGLALLFSQYLNCENQSNNVCGSCPSCFRFQGLQNENLKLVVPLPAPKTKSSNGEENASMSKGDLDLLTESIQLKSNDPFYKICIPRASRILIQTIRDLRKSLYFKGSNTGRKVVAIFDAHLLSVGQGEAANALLKILEEPPENTTLILVTDHQSLLLPTILSRCQLIQFPPLSDDHVNQWLESQGETKNTAYISGLSQGNIHRARKLQNQSLTDVTVQIESFIDQISSTEPNVWRKFTQDYGRLAFQKPDELKSQFQMASLWIHGAYHLRKKLPLSIHETVLKQGMETFNEKFPKSDLQGIVLLLDRVIESMAMNFHMPLILINLLLDIQEKLNE